MNFPTYFIDPQLYTSSVYDLIKKIDKLNLNMCHHPLMVEIIPGDKESIPEYNPDEYVRRRLKRCEQAYKNHDPLAYVFFHARPFRFQALLDAKSWSPEKKWFSAAGSCWVDCEGPGINASIWKSEVFDSPSAYHCMDEDEQDFYNKMESAVVWRGASSRAHAKNGISWTLIEDKARWFAKRYLCTTPWLAKATIRKEHVAVIFLGQGEKEVVLRTIPPNVTVVQL